MEKWNAQRAKAVAHALLKVLYPIMVKELRIKLLDEAKEHVLQVSGGGFYPTEEELTLLGHLLYSQFNQFQIESLHPNSYYILVHHLHN